MTEVAIHADKLSKRYRLGQGYSSTLRDAITGYVSEAFGLGRRGSGGRSKARASGNPNSYIWALKDVSFSVEQGEVIGIIGYNGAGKSTLLKILSRVTDPTSGSAQLRGRIGSLLEVGTGFHQELTGRENVFLTGAILGMKKAEIERKFDEIVSFAEFEKFLDTPVKHYSTGMQVRLAFAVAAHLDTEILLVDEVLAVGDTAFQKKSLGKMREITREGRTVLIVSHNMASIQGNCSRAMMLSKGTLALVGDPRYVVEQYMKSPPVGRSNGVAMATSADGGVSLQTVELVDEEGHPLDRVVSGQSFSIQATYLCRQPIRDAVMEIAIEDNAGRRVALLSNLLVNEDVPILPPSTVVRCLVPDAPLAPGEYNLLVKLTGTNDVELVAPNAAVLRVESGDFFGSGKMVEAWWVGSSLIRHHWNVDEQPRETRVR
jgi:lipopolysaccharide transport system ATP-binding protein